MFDNFVFFICRTKDVYLFHIMFDNYAMCALYLFLIIMFLVIFVFVVT